MNREKLKAFFQDRYRVLAGLAGFLLGLRVFFNAPSLLSLVAAGLLVGCIFFLVVLLGQYFRRRNWKAFALALTAFVLIGGFSFFFLYFGAQSCLMAVYSLDYNSLEGTCNVNTYTCSVDRPWYKSECSGEALKDYCERKNFSSDIEKREKMKMGRDMAGYQACKREGLLD